MWWYVIVLNGMALFRKLTTGSWRFINRDYIVHIYTWPQSRIGSELWQFYSEETAKIKWHMTIFFINLLSIHVTTPFTPSLIPSGDEKSTHTRWYVSTRVLTRLGWPADQAWGTARLNSGTVEGGVIHVSDLDPHLVPNMLNGVHA